MNSYAPFGDEPHLKRRHPRDMRPRCECPLCLERAIILETLSNGDLYVACPHCDWLGAIASGPLHVVASQPTDGETT